jgi:hypothetical protein
MKYSCMILEMVLTSRLNLFLLYPCVLLDHHLRGKRNNQELMMTEKDSYYILCICIIEGELIEVCICSHP